MGVRFRVATHLDQKYYNHSRIRMIFSNSKALSLILWIAVATVQGDVVSAFENESAGNWSVGNCITAQFGMILDYGEELSIRTVESSLTVPPWANATERCHGAIDRCNILNETQILELTWEKAHLDFSPFFNGKILVEYQLMDSTKYGISRINGTFDIIKNEKTGLKLRIEIDSGKLLGDSMIYITSLEDNFSTTNDIKMKINATLTEDIIDDFQSEPIPLKQTSLHIIGPKMSAFKNVKHENGTITFDQEDPCPNNRVKVCCIVGISIGCLCFVGLLIGGIFYAIHLVKRRKMNYQEMS